MQPNVCATLCVYADATQTQGNTLRQGGALQGEMMVRKRRDKKNKTTSGKAHLDKLLEDDEDSLHVPVETIWVCIPIKQLLDSIKQRDAFYEPAASQSLCCSCCFMKQFCSCFASSGHKLGVAHARARKDSAQQINSHKQVRSSKAAAAGHGVFVKSQRPCHEYTMSSVQIERLAQC